jgi:hypothetical protein
MALNAFYLQLLSKVAAKLERPCRLVSLGYPDMLLTEAQLAALVGEENVQHLRFRDDAAGILRWHGLQDDIQRVPETRSVLAMLGIHCEFVDIAASRGDERIVDLNHPVPPELLGRYDIVFDGGTLEHCFNVGQVMRNILGFCKVGGFIMHVNPLNMYNHGFFSFSPTFYFDWYVRSGNQIVTPFFGVSGKLLEQRVVQLEPLAGFKDMPERSGIVVVARKVQAGEPAWPTQSKYLDNPALRRE